MKSKREGYIDVDPIVEQLSVPQVLHALGVSVEAIAKHGSEIRTRCFMQCGKTHDTGNRAIAINTEHPAKIWCCHDYDCPVKKGNLVSMVSLALGLGARPRGADFLTVAKKLKAILDGEPSEPAATASQQITPSREEKQAVPKVNVPLAESSNERVRGIANLHESLTLEPERLPPAVSAYVRRHSILSEDVAARWHIGYLARDGAGDSKGGSMRGKLLAEVANRDGQTVAYCGRDCDWEQKHEQWIRGGREGKEPAKWVFPKNFHRGVEVYAQHRLNPEEHGETLRAVGLPVVEGVMDAVNMWERINVPAVGLLSNRATEDQVRRIAEIAHQIADGVVTLLYDCDEPGDQGAQRDAALFAKHCRVQLGWSQDMYDGAFAKLEPSDLQPHEWQIIQQHLKRRAI